MSAILKFADPATGRAPAMLGPRLAPEALTVAEKRLALIRPAIDRITHGTSVRAAAQWLAGTGDPELPSVTTIGRWLRDYKAGGLMALAPDYKGRTRLDYGWEAKAQALYAQPQHPSYSTVAYWLRKDGFDSALEHRVRRYLQSLPSHLTETSPISFAAGDVGVVEFADWGEVRVAGLFRSLRDFLISKFGQDDADKALPPWSVDGMQFDAATATVDTDANPSIPQFSEQDTSMTPEQIKQRQAELDAKEAKQNADFAEREGNLKKKEQAARRTEIGEFVDGLVKGGKLLPAHKDGLVSFMASTIEDGVVEFGEGDKKKSEPALTWLKTFLSSLPKSVEFREVAKPGAGAGIVNFAGPEGARVDAERLDIHAKAKAYEREHKVDYVTAVKAVSTL